ncbi:penicillin-binding protein 2 [bacterium]|nr:MAG: penicillin-binding protein 2 [bacterium]
MNRRFFAATIFFSILIAVVILRLFFLQVIDHSFYRALAENQHQFFETLVPARGEIFVHESDSAQVIPVVTNIEKNLLYVVPQEVEDKTSLAASLSKIVDIPRAEILQKISDPAKKWVSESETLKIQGGKFAGVYLQPDPGRFYPEGAFASQVLGFYGFVQDQKQGRYGVEEYYQDTLAGKAGSLSQENDPRGRWISSGIRKLEPAQDGADITLTLDQAIQFQAEQHLKAGVEAHQADSGSIIIMNPKTGAILAMANYPSFDPNQFGQVQDQKVFRNNAVSDAFEPGSVFKSITMAAAIEGGAVTPDTTYEDTGQVAVDKFIIKNSDGKANGVQTMTDVLDKSLNTGAIFAMQQLGMDKFFETVKNFGFGTPTGITLPAESGGDIKNLENGGIVHYDTASFGQGITVTLMQLTQAFAAIANQGKMMKPYIVESVKYSDTKKIDTKPEEVRQVISQRTANMLGAMLVSVVEVGHGKRAGVPGYYVAGKTGTAQVAKADGAGYDPNITIGSFAGFAPVDNPAFAMAVTIRNPKGVKFAESTAAPVFGEMAKYLLNYFQIPPTRQN